MKIKISQVIFGAFIFLGFAGCKTVQTYDWSGPKISHGQGGFMRKDDAIEIWVQGAPERDYEILKMAEVTTSGYVGVEKYLYSALKDITEDLHGDGFIMLGRENQSGGYIANSNTVATATPVGSSTMINGTTTTVGGVVKETTFRALVFRYVLPNPGK